MVPRNSHAHITLFFLPLGLRCTRLFSLALRADSLLLYLGTYTFTHAAPTQTFGYQGPGCQLRCSLCRSQHRLESSITLFLYTLLSPSTTLPIHSSPALGHAPGHAPGHSLRRPLMISALLLLAAVELDRLLYCVRATVASIRKQPRCLLFTQAPRQVLMCPAYNLSFFIPLLSLTPICCY